MTVVNIMGGDGPDRKRRRPQSRTLLTRQSLVDAARDLAAQSGLSSLRAEAVVERAGTAKGTLFAHFPDMEHLKAVLIAEQIEGLGVFAEPRKAQDLFLALLPLFRFITSQPEIVTILTRFLGPEGKDTGLAAVVRQRTEELAQAIGSLQGRGGCGSGDPALIAEGLFAFVLHAAVAASCSEDGADAIITSEQTLEQLVDRWLAPPISPATSESAP